MKKANLILMSAIISITLILSSCNGSTKGKWSAADKEKFNKAMEGVDLSNLGENKAKWIECYLGKAEANYSSFDEADKEVEGCKKIALECSNEILSNGSVKGKWSDADHKAFDKVIDGVDLSNLGNNKAAWVDCYYKKCEAKYSSLNEANQDVDGCKALAQECNAEIIK